MVNQPEFQEPSPAKIENRFSYIARSCEPSATVVKETAKTLLTNFGKGEAVADYVDWLDANAADELDEIEAESIRIEHRRAFLNEFKAHWPAYDHAHYAWQLEYADNSPQGRMPDTHPALHDDYVVNRFIDTIIASQPSDAITEPGPYVAGMPVNAHKIELAAFANERFGSQGRWLLRMVDMAHPAEPQVDMIDGNELEAQHHLYFGASVKERIYLHYLSSHLQSKIEGMLGSVVQNDIPEVTYREPLYQYAIDVGISTAYDSIRRASEDQSSEALNELELQRHSLLHRAHSYLEPMVVLEDAEIDIPSLVRRLEKYSTILCSVAQIALRSLRNPGRELSEEEVKIARDWGIAGEDTDTVAEDGANESGFESLSNALNIEDDRLTEEDWEDDMGIEEARVVYDFIERFSTTHILFNFVEVAQQAYPEVDAAYSDGSLQSPEDLLEQYVSGEIAAYEALASKEDLPGISKVLRLERDQFLEAFSLWISFDENAFWLLRMLDDIYEPETGERLALLNPNDLDAKYKALFGRPVAEDIFFGDLISGDELEDFIDERRDTLDSSFPEAMDSDDIHDYLRYYFVGITYSARKDWESARPLTQEGAANMEAFDRAFVAENDERLQALTRKYSLTRRMSLQKKLAPIGKDYLQKVQVQLTEAFGRPK